MKKLLTVTLLTLSFLNVACATEVEIEETKQVNTIEDVTNLKSDFITFHSYNDTNSNMKVEINAVAYDEEAKCKINVYDNNKTNTISFSGEKRFTNTQAADTWVAYTIMCQNETMIDSLFVQYKK